MEYKHPTRKERKEIRRQENKNDRKEFFKPYLEDAEKRRRGD